MNRILKAVARPLAALAFSLLLFAALLAGIASPSARAGAAGPQGNTPAAKAGGATADGTYVDEHARFSIVPPPGFKAWPQTEVKEFYKTDPENLDVPEEQRDQAAKLKSNMPRTVFQPEGNDVSNQSLVVHYGHPVFKTVDEFAETYTAAQQDRVIHSKETLTIDYRPAFVVDWEFDRNGVRMRQIMASVQGMSASAYLITFSAVGVDFPEYRDGYLESLKTFHVMPPKEVAPDLLQNRYAKRGLDPKAPSPAWKSTEVIASVVVVFLVGLWFVVRRLMAGAAESEAAELPGSERDQDSSAPKS